MMFGVRISLGLNYSKLGFQMVKLMLRQRKAIGSYVDVSYTLKNLKKNLQTMNIEPLALCGFDYRSDESNGSVRAFIAKKHPFPPTLEI